MFKTLTAIITATLIALATGPALAAPGGVSSLAEENQQRIDDIENNSPAGLGTVIPQCGPSRIPKYDGASWTCALDNSAISLCPAGTLLVPSPVSPFKFCVPFWQVPGEKRVFISSLEHNGNFGGLVGADHFCQDLADGAGLAGDYKAWLSDGLRRSNA